MKPMPIWIMFCFLMIQGRLLSQKSKGNIIHSISSSIDVVKGTDNFKLGELYTKFGQDDLKKVAMNDDPADSSYIYTGLCCLKMDSINTSPILHFSKGKLDQIFIGCDSFSGTKKDQFVDFLKSKYGIPNSENYNDGNITYIWQGKLIYLSASFRYLTHKGFDAGLRFGYGMAPL